MGMVFKVLNLFYEKFIFPVINIGPDRSSQHRLIIMVIKIGLVQWWSYMGAKGVFALFPMLILGICYFYGFFIIFCPKMG